MDGFYLNGYLWRIKFVDPNSTMLIDRTGKQTVATTDPTTGYIYLANDLEDSFLTRVLIHEIGHCALFSFGLLYEIHRYVEPEYWIEVEEWICNFIADYGLRIFNAAYTILGEHALAYVPYELERWIA